VADLAFGITAEKLRALEGVGLTLDQGALQLLCRDVFEPAAGELVGSLERRPIFVLVRVVPGEIGIAPRRLRRRIASGLRALRWRRRRGLACAWSSALEALGGVDAARAFVVRRLRIRTQRARAIDNAVACV